MTDIEIVEDRLESVGGVPGFEGREAFRRIVEALKATDEERIRIIAAWEECLQHGVGLLERIGALEGRLELYDHAAHIERLRSLQPNWDNDGAPPPTEAALQAAARVFQCIADAAVVPERDGGVSVEWAHAEITFGPDGEQVMAESDAVIERQAAEIAALKSELQAAHNTHDARMKEKNAELLKAHVAATKAYLSSPAMKTFAGLKTSKAGTILSMLQDGAISRGKACEVLALLAHGVDWDDIPLPVESGRQFGEDQVPADVVAALKDSMRQIASGEKHLVMFGSNGCLTDDCGHWDDSTCSMKEPYCRIGRTIDATPKR